MSVEKKNTWLEYQTKPDEKLFVRTFRTDARLSALWLSTAYPEPPFPTGYVCIAKNAKTMMKRSLSWRWWKIYNNAPTEGYYNTLKTELIYQYRFETAAELDYAVSVFTNECYNQVRSHSYNGYPTLFEKRAECTIKQWCYKKDWPLQNVMWWIIWM